MEKENKQLNNWKEDFKEEFGIHFRGSEDELESVISFIEDLIKEEGLKMYDCGWKDGRDMYMLNLSK